MWKFRWMVPLDIYNFLSIVLTNLYINITKCGYIVEANIKIIIIFFFAKTKLIRFPPKRKNKEINHKIRWWRKFSNLNCCCGWITYHKNPTLSDSECFFRIKKIGIILSVRLHITLVSYVKCIFSRLKVCYKNSRDKCGTSHFTHDSNMICNRAMNILSFLVHLKFLLATFEEEISDLYEKFSFFENFGIF